MVDLNSDHWTITPVALSEIINKKRKELNKSPIDHATMMTHLVLKSNVSHPGLFDFDAPELRMDADGIKALEGMLNEQFGLIMERRLSRHCTMVSPAADEAEQAEPQITTNTVPPVERQQSGLISRLSRMFGR